MKFDRIAVAGPGLLGGSVALAIKKYLPGVTLRVWARRQESVDGLRSRGLSAEEASSDLATVFNGASLVVLATPIGVMEDLSRRILKEARLADGAIVTDVGSVKAPVVGALGPFFAANEATFIGAHPMAGSEKNGLDHASADLFQGAACILTPDSGSDPAGREAVAAFWSQLGAETSVLDAEEHDRIVARISHLPHLVAAAVVRAALRGENEAPLGYAGPGFRDTTRVAAGPPEMWAEILLENREAVVEALVDLQDRLTESLEFLRNVDQEQLAGFLRVAKEHRDRLGPGNA